MAVISFELERDIATVTMLDGARRNALTGAMLSELISTFDNLSPEIRVLILRAEDDQPVWCAGFDIHALSPGVDPLARDGHLQQLFSRIAECPIPILAMVRGSTWGGGTDLALRCDMVIADTSCQFAFTPARLGLPYDAEGLLNVLLRAGPAIALEMFATAEPILAERALSVGIVNHLVSPDELEQFTVQMAKRIARNAPFSVSSAKQHLRALATMMSLTATVEHSLNEGRTRALQSQDYAEGLAAFASKRPPNFNGC